MASALVSCLIFFLGIALKTKQNVLKVAESLDKDELEDKFWPQAAVAVNVQSLLHANSRYLRDIPPASASSSRH